MKRRLTRLLEASSSHAEFVAASNSYSNYDRSQAPRDTTDTDLCYLNLDPAQAPRDSTDTDRCYSSYDRSQAPRNSSYTDQYSSLGYETSQSQSHEMTGYAQQMSAKSEISEPERADSDAEIASVSVKTGATAEKKQDSLSFALVEACKNYSLRLSMDGRSFSKPIPTLLDTGASRNFITSKKTAELSFESLIRTQFQLHYSDVNGRRKSTHGMLRLYYDNNTSSGGSEISRHAETANFHVVDKLPYDVVLGMGHSLPEILRLFLKKSPKQVLEEMQRKLDYELASRSSASVPGSGSAGFANDDEEDRVAVITDDGKAMTAKERQAFEAQIAAEEKAGKERIAREVVKKAMAAAKVQNGRSSTSGGTLQAN